MIDRARLAVQEVDESARTRQEEALRRQAAARSETRRARLLYVLAIVGCLVISLAALVVATFRAETSAQDVAGRVTPVVAERLIQDARQQRATNARAILGATNEALTAQGLPTVQDPGPTANADQLVVTASTAQVLLVLPEPVKEQLRAEGQDVFVLPQPNGTVAPGSGPAPTSDPGTGEGGASSGGSGSSAPRTTGQVEPSAFAPPPRGSGAAPTAAAPRPSSPGAGSPAPVPAPAPAPQPERGGIRLDLPLLPDVELPLPRIRLGVNARL